MSSKQPFVFIFDIDSTIIGHIHYIYNEYKLHEIMKNKCQTKLYSADKETDCNKMINYNSLFKSMLIRPYFVDFVNFIRERFSPCEMFLYTMSTHNIIHDFFIDHFERETGIRFNRPIFTRDDAVLRSKSIFYVIPRIEKCLKERYENIDMRQIIRSNLIFIDDRIDNIYDLKSKQLVCPPYQYTVFYDIFRKARKIYPRSQMKQIIESCNETGIDCFDPFSKDITIKSESLFNQRLKLLKIQYEIINKQASKDRFFKELMTLLESKKDLSDKNIQQLNKTLKQRVKPVSMTILY